MPIYREASPSLKLAFINADWQDFWNTPAVDEDRKTSILIDDYLRILNKTGWQHTHIIQAPMGSFNIESKQNCLICKCYAKRMEIKTDYFSHGMI